MLKYTAHATKVLASPMRPNIALSVSTSELTIPPAALATCPARAMAAFSRSSCPRFSARLLANISSRSIGIPPSFFLPSLLGKTNIQLPSLLVKIFLQSFLGKDAYKKRTGCQQCVHMYYSACLTGVTFPNGILTTTCASSAHATSSLSAMVCSSRISVCRSCTSLMLATSSFRPATSSFRPATSSFRPATSSFNAEISLCITERISRIFSSLDIRFTSRAHCSIGYRCLSRIASPEKASPAFVKTTVFRPAGRYAALKIRLQCQLIEAQNCVNILTNSKEGVERI